MTYCSLRVESVGVVCSERSRVPQFDSTAGTRTRRQWAELTRAQAFKKCVVLRCACAQSPRYLNDSGELATPRSSSPSVFRRHRPRLTATCSPSWSSRYPEIRNSRVVPRAFRRPTRWARAHNAAAPVRGALGDGGSAVRRRGPVLQ